MLLPLTPDFRNGPQQQSSSLVKLRESQQLLPGNQRKRSGVINQDRSIKLM